MTLYTNMNHKSRVTDPCSIEWYGKRYNERVLTILYALTKPSLIFGRIGIGHPIEPPIPDYFRPQYTRQVFRSHPNPMSTLPIE